MPESEDLPFTNNYPLITVYNRCMIAVLIERLPFFSCTCETYECGCAFGQVFFYAFKNKLEVTLKKRDHVYTIDDYAYRSPLRNWNLALKAGFAMAVLVMGIGISQPLVSGWMIMTGLLVSILGCRVPVRDYLELLAVPLVFVALGCAAIAVQINLEDGLHLYLSRESVMEAVNVALRTLGAVSILYVLVLSTPVHEIAAVLRRLHVPKIMTELMVLIYRYIFLLVDAQHTMRLAAESRLGYCDFKTSCRTFGHSMSSLLLVSMRKASRYYDAMLSRGYDGELLFLEEEKTVKVWQALLLIMYVASLFFWKLAGEYLTAAIPSG